MSDRVLAAKYARAFCGVYPSVCTLDTLDPLKAVCSFFSSHKNALFLLGLPQLDEQVKRNAIEAIVRNAGVSLDLCDLFMLLIRHKRAALIPRVCTQIRRLILLAHKAIECTIATVHELDDEQRATLQKFFTQQADYDMRAQFVIDKSLIAGIAMRSDTYAWEYSVRKQLHTIKQSLIR